LEQFAEYRIETQHNLQAVCQCLTICCQKSLEHRVCFLLIDFVLVEIGTRKFDCDLLQIDRSVEGLAMIDNMNQIWRVPLHQICQDV